MEALLRQIYMEKTEEAWTQMIASQGDSKSMKKWVGQWHRLIYGKKKQGNDLAAFLRDLGLEKGGSW